MEQSELISSHVISSCPLLLIVRGPCRFLNCVGAFMYILLQWWCQRWMKLLMVVKVWGKAQNSDINKEMRCFKCSGLSLLDHSRKHLSFFDIGQPLNKGQLSLIWRNSVLVPKCDTHELLFPGLCFDYSVLNCIVGV